MNKVDDAHKVESTTSSARLLLHAVTLRLSLSSQRRDEALLTFLVWIEIRVLVTMIRLTVKDNYDDMMII